MAETTPPVGMITNLSVTPAVVYPGREVSVTPSVAQNRKIVSLSGECCVFAIFLIESRSNNVSSILDPKDVVTINDWYSSFSREWARAIKFNRGGGGNRYEETYPVVFPTLEELQKMHNTPVRRLANLVNDLYQMLVTSQSASLQSYVSENVENEVNEMLVEIKDYIDTELGTGLKEEGRFNLGAKHPDFSRIGELSPSPVGATYRSEPSSAVPPTLPNDVPDIK